MNAELTNDPRRQASLNPPRYRGVLHTWMVPAAIVAGLVTVFLAPSNQARVLAGIFAFTVVTMFAVSATFHRGTWTDRQWWLMRQLDQTAIYLIIAGSYTGLAGLALDEPWRTRLLVGVWLATALGIAMVWLPFRVPFGLNTGIYIVIAAFIVTRLGDLWNAIGFAGIALIGTGMIIYLLGGLALGARVPNPRPGIFGYHEVWHVLVTVSVILHYCAVLFVIFPAIA